MIEATLRWTEEDQFAAEAASGHPIALDAGNDRLANSPVELVLIALCGCTAADVVNILRKKREPCTGLEVSARGNRAPDPPKVFTDIQITYRVSGNVSHKAMEDAVRLSEEKYCSVSIMLSKTAKISYKIEYAP